MRIINVVRNAGTPEKEEEGVETEPTFYTLRERTEGVWSVEKRHGGPESKPTDWPEVFASMKETRVVPFRRERQRCAPVEITSAAPRSWA